MVGDSGAAPSVDEGLELVNAGTMQEKALEKASKVLRK
jgi:hypothetical protein